MSDTNLFQMPLLDAAQAQKHVTVNEALVRADALAAGQVLTLGQNASAPAPSDGEMHVVGPSATGAWADHANELAIFLNGGWVFVVPWAGYRVWIEEDGEAAIYDGLRWVVGRIAGTASGSATLSRVVELDHEVLAGASSVTTPIIPDKAVVLGVTGRVVTEITGTDTWSLGVPGSTDRYGNGYGKDFNSFVRGVTSQPLAYFGDTPLELTADDGAFTGGVVRLAVHFADLLPPDPV